MRGIMTGDPSSLPSGFMRLLARIARDNGGNVLMIFAASLFPLLALIGSGIDMGRGYLAETRLQQACDDGVLAARKRLGTEIAVNGNIPSVVSDTGQRFFNINFRQNAYGSENRQFQMVLEDNFSISGTASADVPTTIMNIFGHRFLSVSVSCQAQLNMPNTDVMMVLDTTGSMLRTNDGDSETRIEALRSTVKSFHAQLEGNKSPGTTIRYGFVPYSTNVNVGHLLQDDWLVDEWDYNFREARDSGRTVTTPVYETSWRHVAGTSTNGATYTAFECPANTMTSTQVNHWTTRDGWEYWQWRQNGTNYSCNEDVDSGIITITPNTRNNWEYVWGRRQTGTQETPVSEWRYDSFEVDLSFLQTRNTLSVPMGGNPNNPSNVTVSYRGYIEERDTYMITYYDNVDLRRALDLDLDTPPDPDDPDTQWRPMLNELSYAREMTSGGRGVFTPSTVNTSANFVNSWWWGFGACPSPARGLAEMTAEEVAAYVDGLDVQGSTYHDIGMIWGSRLISPTGMFAPETNDISTQTSRHLIYLTDGETSPLDISYGPYGIEPLDRRRWMPTWQHSLTETVEFRFSFACEEVKKRNVQVWVISFGTDANPVMEACAGAGRYFAADDASELEAVFSDIAARLGELRIVD